MNEARDVVVIGAALGGVSAIAELALSWPLELPATVLIALSTPNQPADIVLQIIASYAPVRVAYAVQGELVKPRHIYLSPPGKHLIVQTGGMVHLDDGNFFDTNKPSVNRLFAAAASVYGSRVIGIVLSGDHKDGAQGLMDIEAAGGVCIVQKPDDAIDPVMPLNAIRKDHPRYCVDACEIAPLVKRLLKKQSA